MLPDDAIDDVGHRRDGEDDGPARARPPATVTCSRDGRTCNAIRSYPLPSDNARCSNCRIGLTPVCCTYSPGERTSCGPPWTAKSMHRSCPSVHRLIISRRQSSPGKSNIVRARQPSRQEIESRTDHNVPRGAVYTTLDRPEDKRNLTPWHSQPMAKRGGARAGITS